MHGLAVLVSLLQVQRWSAGLYCSLHSARIAGLAQRRHPSARSRLGGGCWHLRWLVSFPPLWLARFFMNQPTWNTSDMALFRECSGLFRINVAPNACPGSAVKIPE